MIIDRLRKNYLTGMLKKHTIYVFYGILYKDVERVYTAMHNVDPLLHVWYPCYVTPIKGKIVRQPKFPNYLFVFTMLPEDNVKELTNIASKKFYCVDKQIAQRGWRRGEILKFYSIGGIKAKRLLLNDIRELL